VIERLDTIATHTNGQNLEERRAQQILMEILQSTNQQE